jgi:hypothetical protein
MPQSQISCPQCQTPFSFEGKLSFREECERCAADLHVCVLCSFYDSHADNQCRETTADPVPAKERRNLCEYWRPASEPGSPTTTADDAKAQLDALFGGPSPQRSAPGPTDDARAKLDALFKKKGG